MNNSFFRNYKLYLTPLSPIHMGCGEDFEPTNYVIDNNVLYGFDIGTLAPILTNEERAKLLNITNTKRDTLLQLQRFFIEKKEQLTNIATYYSEVSPELANEVLSKIGKTVQREDNDKKVFNSLIIERNSYLPFSSQPYIPGSGVKGAIVTSVLNSYVNNGDRHLKDNEIKNKYVGTFDNSLFSLFKISDFVPGQDSVGSYVYYVVNRKKVKAEKGEAKGVDCRRECIQLGQYRAFKAELAFWDNDKSHEGKIRKLSLIDICEKINQFYLKQLINEIKLLTDRQLLNLSWRTTVIQLLKTIAPQIDSGKILLVRIGRNTGAESKSYREANLAEIKINLGKGKQERKSEATTIWLAGKNTEKHNKNLLPLGWALIEIEPETENPALREWVDKQEKLSINKELLSAQRKKFISNLAVKKEQEKQKIEEEINRRREQEEMFAAMNDNQKAVIALVNKYKESNEIQLDINSILLRETKEFIENAIAQWNEEDRKCVFDYITLDLVSTRVKFQRKNGDKDFRKLCNKLVY